MAHRLRRWKDTPTTRIAGALQDISMSLQQLVEYKRVEENRQEIFSNIAAGMVPMLQKFVAEQLGPHHPPTWMHPNPRRPNRAHRAHLKKS